MKRTGNSTQQEMLNPYLIWQHDVTGEQFTGKCAVSNELNDITFHLQWFDCIIGGYIAEFTVNDTKYQFNMTHGIKGMNIPGVIAFDAEGKAVVFY
jgi:hypothetical protein